MLVTCGRDLPRDLSPARPATYSAISRSFSCLLTPKWRFPSAQDGGTVLAHLLACLVLSCDVVMARWVDCLGVVDGCESPMPSRDVPTLLLSQSASLLGSSCLILSFSGLVFSLLISPSALFHRSHTTLRITSTPPHLTSEPLNPQRHPLPGPPQPQQILPSPHLFLPAPLRHRHHHQRKESKIPPAPAP